MFVTRARKRLSGAFSEVSMCLSNCISVKVGGEVNVKKCVRSHRKLNMLSETKGNNAKQVTCTMKGKRF